MHLCDGDHNIFNILTFTGLCRQDWGSGKTVHFLCFQRESLAEMYLTSLCWTVTLPLGLHVCGKDWYFRSQACVNFSLQFSFSLELYIFPHLFSKCSVLKCCCKVDLSETYSYSTAKICSHTSSNNYWMDCPKIWCTQLCPPQGEL